jgi:hypothetical protein
MVWHDVFPGTTIGKFRNGDQIRPGVLLKVRVKTIEWSSRIDIQRQAIQTWLVGHINPVGDSQGVYNEDDIELLAWSDSLCNDVDKAIAEQGAKK